MANCEIYGVVDIGSNAVRNYIARVKKGEIKKIFSRRYPLRLGKSVFRDGKLSEKAIKKLREVLLDSLEIFDELGVTDELCVATSAMRDASNGGLVSRELSEIIPIHIIDGKKEASLVHSALVYGKDLDDFVMVDLGGGSLEVVISRKGKIQRAKSFNIGAVRYLSLPEKERVAQLQRFEKELIRFLEASAISELPVIGIGGNFKSLLRIQAESTRRDCSALKKSNLEMICEFFNNEKTLGRFKKENSTVRKNRLDLLPGASRIILNAMGTLHAKKVYIPHVGLKHGLIWSLYRGDF